MTTVVSVILVNYESGDLGLRAARSARAQAGVEVELIVVDNASTDDSLAAIVERCAPERVVRHTTNRGYAAAVDAGAALATGAVLMPLNCDAELGPGYLATALEVLAVQPRVAVVAGRVEQTDGTVWGAMRVTVSMRVRAVPGAQGPAVRVDASCPVWRREALDEVCAHTGRAGPLDERFFVYGENIDLACSLRRLGWISWYEPRMRAIHERSFASARRVADKRGLLRANVIASRWSNVVRHGLGWRLPAGLLGCVAEDLGFVALRLLAGDFAAPRDVVAAWRLAARHRRADLHVRRALPRQAISLATRRS